MHALRCSALALCLAMILLTVTDAHANDPEPTLPAGQMFDFPTFEPLSGLSVNIGIGSAWQEVSKVSQGTVIFGADEVPLARSDGRILTTRVNGGLSYDWGEACCADNLRTSFDFDTTWGDELVTRAVAPGTQQAAITYHGFAPSGSTGILVGTTGLSSRQRIKLETHDLRLTTHWDFDVCDAADVTLSPSVSLVYAGREQLALGGSTSDFNPNIRSRSEQRVNDAYHGAGVGLGAGLQVTPNLGIHGNAGIDLLYNRSTLRSLQWNECNDIGCPPADVNPFRSNIQSNFDGFAWKSRLDVAATWKSGPLSLNGSLGFDYLSDRGDLINPVSPPAGNHTFFVRKSALEPRFSMSVSYRF